MTLWGLTFLLLAISYVAKSDLSFSSKWGNSTPKFPKYVKLFLSFNWKGNWNINLIHLFSFCNQFPEETELDLLSVTIEGPSHYSSNSEGSCSVFSSPKTPGSFSPNVPFQHEEGRRDDSLSSTSEDSEKDEKDEDRERERFYIYRKPSWVAFWF